MKSLLPALAVGAALLAAQAACSSDTKTPADTTEDAGTTSSSSSSSSGGTAKNDGGRSCGATEDQDTCASCCSEQNPAGAAKYSTFSRKCLCTDAVCKKECGATICATVPVNADKACSDCFAAKSEMACSDPLTADCLADPECTKLNQCFIASDCPSKKKL